MSYHLNKEIGLHCKSVQIHGRDFSEMTVDCLAGCLWLEWLGMLDLEPKLETMCLGSKCCEVLS